MGMGFALTWLRQVSPPASQNHFNHWPRPYGRGAEWPIETCFSPTCATMPNSVKPFERIYGNVRKCWPHAPPFTDTQGHWNRYGSIGDLWLPISVPNYGPILYHFRDKGQYLQKKFHTPCKFNAPAEGFLRKFVTALRLKKTGRMSLKMVIAETRTICPFV